MSTYFKDNNSAVTNYTGASALIDTAIFCKIIESILPSFTFSSDGITQPNNDAIS